MKRLWKMIPPCFSDVQGFQTVLNDTNGLGIVDDPSRYKPLRMDGNKAFGRPQGDFRRSQGEFGRPQGEYGGRPQGEFGRHQGEFGRPQGEYGRPQGEFGRHQGGFGRHQGGFGRPQGEYGRPQGEYGRKPGGFGGRGLPGMRVVNSDIRDADIIHGTQEKVLEAFDRSVSQYNPDFVLLAYAPSSSMIGSDLDTAAEIIGQRSGLPAACVDVHGDKDYLYGVSRTLEVMGKLLLTKQATIPNTVNLLGCNSVDWCQETLADTEKLLSGAGYTVLSRWGAKETTENLKKASAASVNLVVTAAGFRLARYMEAEFGIPYIVGAPFGAHQCATLLDELRGTPNSTESSACETPEVLVIGEQLTAVAIRRALLHRGYQNIQVLSFFEMEKSCMAPGDQKLSSEDDLAEKIQQPSVRLVIGAPDYQAAAPRDIPWIGLPDGASMSPVNPIPNFNMAGEALDRWLDSALQNRSNV